MTGFLYLASSYSLHPRGLEAAFVDAARAAGLFASAGIPVFSPISHSHPIAVIVEIDPRDHKIWIPFDQPMMNAAKGLVVLMNDGWQDSYGIDVEIEEFTAAGKPVFYMTPGILPKEVLTC